MSVASLYRYVVDDVIKNIRVEFLNEGVDEQVLSELQQYWETKLIQSGAISSYGSADGSDFSSQQQTYAPYDLSAYNTNPYLSTDNNPSYAPLDLTQNPLYQMNPPLYLNGTPTASSSTPTTSTHAHTHPHHPHTHTQMDPSTSTTTTTTATSRQYNPTSTELAASALRSLNSGTGNLNVGVGLLDHHPLGRPQQYMAAPGSVTGWGDPQVNVNLAEPRRTASNASIRSILSDRTASIPQHDGANDDDPACRLDMAKKVDSIIKQKYAEVCKKNAEKSAKKKAKTIPQVDGLGDNQYSGEKRKRSDSDDDSPADSPKDDEDTLDSDLDDEDDAEPETEHLVLCQFEKVTRIKNKRKCNLKDGIMHLHGRDSVFHKATGEFDW